MNKNLQSDKKNNILMAAVKVLTNKGYYSSTMDDIVAESKMSKGAIYHYYSSKKDVYGQLQDMMMILEKRCRKFIIVFKDLLN